MRAYSYQVPKIARCILLLSLSAGIPACAPAAQSAIRPAVDAGIDEATERDVARNVEQLLSTPEMRNSLAEVSSALLEGAHGELSQEEWEVLLRARSEDLVEGMAPALARILETDIGPAVRAELARAIQLSLEQLSGTGAQAQLVDVARWVTTAVLDTMVSPASASAHTGERSPVRRATEDAMLGIGDALDGDFGVSMHAFLLAERRAIGREVATSVQETQNWRATSAR